MPKKYGNNSDLATFFTAADLVCRTPLTDRDEIILDLLKRLAFNHGIGNVPSVFEMVLARENSRSTIVAEGIAMPHARVDGIAQPFVAVATSEAGIRFCEDSGLVYAVIVVLTPRDQPALYLQILRALATILRDGDAVQRLRAFTQPEELMRFLRRGGLVLPDYVCAADVMSETPVTLKDNDSLKTAIDLFVERDLIQIPVVDKDGDLVGVVSADALLHVCLPDYLLWMDDLSPIQNFEPFVAVLHNEQNTWLGEILSERYAAVQLAAPAISVAAEFTRLSTTHCYVLEDRRLAGEITLQRFLDKVFRE